MVTYVNSSSGREWNGTRGDALAFVVERRFGLEISHTMGKLQNSCLNNGKLDFPFDLIASHVSGLIRPVNSNAT